jgi:protein-S-isoprenylcysteine O-methyltransferase Ste14
MKSSPSSSKGETRFVFRILACVIAVFLLLIGLPAAISEALNRVWEGWFCAFSCLYAGVGLATGAWTGRWFCFKRIHDPRA